MKTEAVASALPKLAIIAGGGAAPRELIAACQKAGRDFVVVCLEGQAETETAAAAPHLWLSLGAAVKLKQLVQNEKVAEIVMLGRVRRPSLLEIKPDWLALKILTKIGMNMLGDDALLQAIGRALEVETGARLVGAHQIYAALLATEGKLTRVQPDELAEQDIARGIAVARGLGQLDVGQAVVVQQGMVIGVEAIEGTDALIARCAQLQRSGMGGVLVKLAKPQQDVRYDLPTIGVGTVEAMVKAGLRGVMVEAGRSMIVERERTIAAADAAGLFIVSRELSHE